MNPEPGNKEKVLKRFPSAYLWSWADGYCIYSGEFVNRMLGTSGHKTPRQAWKSAVISGDEGNE